MKPLYCYRTFIASGMCQTYEIAYYTRHDPIPEGRHCYGRKHEDGMYYTFKRKKTGTVTDGTGYVFESELETAMYSGGKNNHESIVVYSFNDELDVKPIIKKYIEYNMKELQRKLDRWKSLADKLCENKEALEHGE